MNSLTQPAKRALSQRELLFISGSDVFVLGHYPGNPVYPGALMLDRMLTIADKLASQTIGSAARAQTVKRVQYLGVVVPGDIVVLDVSVLGHNGGAVNCEAVASVAGEERVRATIVCGPDTGAPPLPAVVPDMPTNAPALNHQQIARLLPHRYPFLLLDTVRSYTAGERIIATKVVNRQSPILGHRPPEAYPATLAIESFGQAGVSLFYLNQAGGTPAHALVGLMRDVTLHRPIPYDTVLTLDVRIDRLRSNTIVFGGEIRIGDVPVIQVGSLVVMIASGQTSQTSG